MLSLHDEGRDIYENLSKQISPMDLDITQRLSINTSEHDPQNTYEVYKDIM
jgi:hypothetical protein